MDRHGGPEARGRGVSAGADAPGSVLRIDGLEVFYGAIQALRDVTLEVRAGEIVTLIGANGAGKSTLLRTISGLLQPRSGRMTYHAGGKALDLGAIPSHHIVRHGISHVPEGRGIFANLSVRENLELGAYLRRDRAGIKADRERVFQLFPRLAERIGQNAGTLSGGEQQMLAIGRALMARPRLLLLDEPSLGLAPRLVHAIFDIVKEINAAGTPILLVEQNARMALSIAHRGYVMEVGSIVLEGEGRALLANDEVRQAYFGEAG
jgi:branched-chain amino acid transport system ATP-binding protein